MRFIGFACDWCGSEAKGTDITRDESTQGGHLPAGWMRLSIPPTTGGILTTSISRDTGLAEMDTCGRCAHTRVAPALGGLLAATPE